MIAMSVILLAEDDPLLSMLVQEILEERGYIVLSVGSADDALSRLEHDPDIDLVVTDIDMPGRYNGFDLAARIHDDRPAIPVIIASGKHRPTAAELHHAAFLPKPFRAEQLLAMVSAALPATC